MNSLLHSDLFQQVGNDIAIFNKENFEIIITLLKDLKEFIIRCKTNKVLQSINQDSIAGLVEDIKRMIVIDSKVRKNQKNIQMVF